MSGLVRGKADYDEMIADLKRVSASQDPIGSDLAIDTETTGLRLYLDDRPTGISVAYWTEDDEVKSWYLSVNHPDSKNMSPRRLMAQINRHQGTQVFHHAEFDWKSLTLAGNYKLPKVERLYDTQVMEWLLDENTDHRLKQMSAKYFGEDAKAEQDHIRALKRGRKASDIYRELRLLPEWQKPRPAAEARAESKRLAEATKKDWATFTAEDLEAYGARDAELTLMCKRQQSGDGIFDDGMVNAEIMEAFERELKLLYVLYRMMGQGIRVNKEACVAQAHVAQQRLDILSAKFEGVNLNSPAQLGALVYDDWGIKCKHFTDTGARSTAKEALEEHDDDPRIEDLLEYRHLNKAMVGYYKPLYETIAEDGRIHPSFSSSRTVTGRLSCSDPNLMTIPRADTLEGVRDLFVPADGYELWEFDLAQAELRIMAGFCEDETLMGALNNGDDLHSLTASKVFGPNFTPLQRRVGKNLNYGFPYGVGPRKAAKYRIVKGETLTQCAYWDWDRNSGEKRGRRCGKCHVCLAADDLDGYRRAYPRLVQLMGGLERVARRDGVLPMIIDGRYRHFRSPGRIVHFYTALNAVVQGGVAECMKSYMIAAEPGLIKLGARLCLQVHDSLVIEVLPGTGHKVGELLQSVADEFDYFLMRMLFDCKNWSDHD